jgi:hypothetical protein
LEAKSGQWTLSLDKQNTSNKISQQQYRGDSNREREKNVEGLYMLEGIANTGIGCIDWVVEESAALYLYCCLLLAGEFFSSTHCSLLGGSVSKSVNANMHLQIYIAHQRISALFHITRIA